MKSARQYWIGADPGGKGCFGVAILASDGNAQVFSVDCADEAVEAVCSKLDSAPAGVGVDAPMWWSSGRSSDRLADRWLRKTYKLTGGQVQTANSLRGAALVQGAMFVDRLRRRFPGTSVTESHPKALLVALKCYDLASIEDRFAVKAMAGNEHERDAVVAAIAAREGFEGRWRLDLSRDRLEAEQDPQSYWLSPVHYFWPSP